MGPNRFVALCGKPYPRWFNGRIVSSSAFVGTNNDDEPGIGFFFPQDAEMKPIFFSHPFFTGDIIALYWSAKLLGMTKKIASTGETFVACTALFCAEYRRLSRDDAFIPHLAKQFGGMKFLEYICLDIEKSFPSMPNLETLLEHMCSRQVAIDLSGMRNNLGWYRRHGSAVNEFAFFLQYLEKVLGNSGTLKGYSVLHSLSRKI